MGSAEQIRQLVDRKIRSCSSWALAGYSGLDEGVEGMKLAANAN
jgi:hypothetical protein